ncbi:unnamed protein product [Microthlaspi erraticum]|uniref:Legume lectin domain-containing protein n=1 Tax=Microthlaspi erraticum TaxID=1685480 RepID=A0A6D2HII4_9BRAS|nr:unnamed protein product [Microthlaspi erraticum]
MKYSKAINHVSGSYDVLVVDFSAALRPQECSMSNANHVGVDINSLVSDKAEKAGYFNDDGTFRDLLLSSGDSMQVWIEYDSKQKQLNVTLHPVNVPKPKIPLLSLEKDLSPYLLEYMFIGFTSATGALTASHYILDWKFKMNGKKLMDVLEDWEVQFRTHRFIFHGSSQEQEGQAQALMYFRLEW